LGIISVGSIGRNTGKVIFVFTLSVIKFTVVTGLGEVGSSTVDIEFVIRHSIGLND
jgi:hypothetical protein